MIEGELRQGLTGLLSEYQGAVAQTDALAQQHSATSEAQARLICQKKE